MRRVKLVLAVAAAMVAMMAFAGPAFASTDGSCIHVPLSPLSAAPTTFSALLLQLAVAVGIAVVAAAVALVTSTIRPAATAGTTT